MNKERIEQIVEEWSDKVGAGCTYHNNHLREAITQAVNEALDDACKTVYGQCGNDNVAQRTVDAIRKMKV